MPTEITVALIGLLGSGLGAFVGILTSTKLTSYRIEQLEKKVEKHNNIIERTYRLENRLDEEEKLTEEKMKVINHRIADLEHYHK